jgi:capsular exopolysaccharide synthesis family protein
MRKSKAPAFAQLPPEVRNQLEKLKSTILLSAAKKRIRSILFVSYNHGEGASTVARNFAQSMAQDKRYKTLLVDANTRTPSLQASGIDPDNGTVTFSGLFTEGLEAVSLPKPQNGANLTLIPGGQTAHHPSQVFNHRRFGEFIASAKKLYHFVLFDSSPLGKYYDSVVLGSHMDGVVLVAEAEKTQLHELKWAKQLLDDRQIPVLGVVLNKRRFWIPSFIYERVFA